MAKTYKEIRTEARKLVPELSPAGVKQTLDRGEKPVLLDVREKEEYRDGHLEGALSLPRGFLEIRVEEAVPDHSTPIVAYCAGGTRSRIAARTLRDMGYENVISMSGGFTGWKNAGLPFATDRQWTQEQATRYSRPFLLPEAGEKGQAKLFDEKVLCIGAGGLGSPTAFYLAAAGVGTIGLVDHDVVDLSNLQRQILHTNDRIGMPKVDSAELTLKALNPDVKVVKFQERLSAENVRRIFEGFDIIVNGCDNFPTRYLVNDACVFPKKGPCYRCLSPEPPPPGAAPSCAEAGVLGVLPGLVGCVQALETIKLILGAGKPLIGRMIQFDTMSMDVRILKLRRDPNCVVCGDH